MNRIWLTTITISLLVAACSGTGTETVAVTFDGDSCSYTGPGEFDLDTELTIDLTNEAGTSLAFGVWKVPEGTTIEDIETQGLPVVASPESENERGILRPGSVRDRTLTVILNETGTLAFNCFQFDSPPSPSDYPAVIVEVR